MFAGHSSDLSGTTDFLKKGFAFLFRGVVPTPFQIHQSGPFADQSGTTGDWTITGEGRNRSAVFRDNAGHPLGFALTGDETKSRMAVAKTVPDLLAA